MEDNDTLEGGDGLSLSEAARAFAQSELSGAGDGQPDDDEDFDQSDNVDQDQDDDDYQSEEETGDEPDDDSQPDDDEDDEPEEPDAIELSDSNARVRLSDGSELTVGELLEGNLRERDYRQKTMELGEQRRALEAQSSDLQASMQRITADREYIDQLLTAFTPKKPNFADYGNNTSAYLQAEQAYEAYAAHHAEIRNQMESVKKQAEQDEEQSRLSKSAQEWATLQNKRPELKDEKRLAAFASDLKAAGLAYGFSEQEIGQNVPMDHRMAMVLADAGKWRKLQATKAKQQPSRDRPPVQKGAKRRSEQSLRTRQATDAVKKLRKSGSVTDAVAAYLATQKG